MSTATEKSLIRHSEPVADWSNANTEKHSLYHYSVTLYRHKDGRYFLRQTYGGAIRIHEARVVWISEQEARDFIRDHAIGIDGYGFTDSEIAELMTGGNPRGTRNEPVPTRPNCWGL